MDVAFGYVKWRGVLFFFWTVFFLNALFDFGDVVDHVLSFVDPGNAFHEVACLDVSDSGVWQRVGVRGIALFRSVVGRGDDDLRAGTDGGCRGGDYRDAGRKRVLSRDVHAGK